MARCDALDERNVATILAAPVFFVATAAADGRINLSRKGSGCFRVLSPRTLLPETRQIFDAPVQSVQTSRGWDVPRMGFGSERQSLLKAHSQADSGVWAGTARNGRASIVGLPARTTDRYIPDEWTGGPAAYSQPGDN